MHKKLILTSDKLKVGKKANQQNKTHKNFGVLNYQNSMNEMGYRRNSIHREFHQALKNKFYSN
jgi:hypothetical protein